MSKPLEQTKSQCLISSSGQRLVSDSLPPFSMIATGQILDFVRSVRQRYEKGPVPRSKLSFVYLQQLQPLELKRFYSTTQVSLQPRLKLVLPTLRVPAQGVIQHQKKRSTYSQIFLQPGTKIDRQLLVSRLLKRGERLDIGSGYPGESSRKVVGESQNLEVSRPVPLIVSKSGVRQVETGSPITASDRDDHLRKGPRRRLLQADKIEADFRDDKGLDIARLTDQVVQAIDRRIAARRERLGKI